MIARYRYPLLAVLSVALLGAAPLAQARDRHIDFSIVLGLPAPPVIYDSFHHGYAPYHGYYRPRVVAHYHGRRLCHLRHEVEHIYEHDRYYNHRPRYRDHYYRD